MHEEISISNKAGLDPSLEKANDCDNHGPHKNRQFDEQLYTYLADNIIGSSLFPIVVTNPRGCITWVNDAFQETFGYKIDEVDGKFIAEISPSKAGQYETVSGEKVEIDE